MFSEHCAKRCSNQRSKDLSNRRFDGALWLAVLMACALTSTAGAQLVTGGYDANAAWPLCGNLFETQPDALDCPSSRHGNILHRDDTNDTFGPRLIGTRYDWHRGVDVDTDGLTNRMVYASTCGVVVEVDTSAGRPNYSVTLRHYRDEICNGGPPPAGHPVGLRAATTPDTSICRMFSSPRVTPSTGVRPWGVTAPTVPLTLASPTR